MKALRAGAQGSRAAKSIAARKRTTLENKLRGLTREEAYAVGREEGAHLTAAELQDIASSMVSTRQFRWCRARVLHALAGSLKQGKLAEALDETLDADSWDRILDGARDPEELTSNLIDALGEKLRENGWVE